MKPPRVAARSHDLRSRVVHIAGQLHTGGMERLLVEFARYADRRRFDLQFLSLGGRGAVADEIEACGWPVTSLGEPTGLRAGLVFRLARLLRGWKTDVVHAHNTKPLLYAAPAARLAGVRSILQTRHGQALQQNRRRAVALRLASRLAHHVVCVSHDSRRLAAHCGLPAPRLSTLWNGVDLARFPYTGPQVDGPAVTVARLSPEKDIATLLRALPMVIQRHPRFRLLVAGDGACRPELECLAAEMNLDGHVQFLGEVRDIPALLATASLFVLPSLTEGISLTLLEAMASGLPVVATDVGGNAEVVVNGQTGCLAPPGKPEHLACAIDHVLSLADRGSQMGRQGRDRAEEHFDVRRMVRQYEELYERLLLGAPAGAPVGAVA